MPVGVSAALLMSVAPCIPNAAAAPQETATATTTALSQGRDVTNPPLYSRGAHRPRGPLLCRAATERTPQTSGKSELDEFREPRVIAVATASTLFANMDRYLPKEPRVISKPFLLK